MAKVCELEFWEDGQKVRRTEILPECTIEGLLEVVDAYKKVFGPEYFPFSKKDILEEKDIVYVNPEPLADLSEYDDILKTPEDYAILTAFIDDSTIGFDEAESERIHREYGYKLKNPRFREAVEDLGYFLRVWL